jgi:hypothetical protein
VSRLSQSAYFKGAILSGILLFTACMTPAYQLGPGSWYRPDGTEGDFGADSSECRMVASSPASVVSGRGNVMRTHIDDVAYVKCMKERNWKLR